MSNVKKVNTTNFQKDVLEADKLTIVDFQAVWCGGCKVLGPILDELSGKNSDANIYQVDVDESPELAAKYGIRGIPTMLFFKNGVVVKTAVGSKPESEIVEMINSTK